MQPKIHTLASGALVLSLSPHPFRFSDGTVSEPQNKEVCDLFTLTRKFERVDVVKGMAVSRVQMVLSDEQLARLTELAKSVDIVLVPFPVLSAMREQGVRDRFRNVLAFNATKETQRSAPDEKVVDIDNWSY